MMLTWGGFFWDLVCMLIWILRERDIDWDCSCGIVKFYIETTLRDYFGLCRMTDCPTCCGRLVLGYLCRQSMAPPEAVSLASSVRLSQSCQCFLGHVP
jgi:hypothetical protein